MSSSKLFMDCLSLSRRIRVSTSQEGQVTHPSSSVSSSTTTKSVTSGTWWALQKEK